MAAYTINQELNGIEITFEAKPTADTLASLKANGYRWHRVKKVWYAKQTPDRLAIAESLTAGQMAPQAAPVAPKANIINLDNLGQNTPRLYGAELAAAIREDLKKRGAKGVTVRARKVTYETGITVTIKATADDFVSLEEAKTRYNFSRFSCDIDRPHGKFNGTKWIYYNEYEQMTDEEKENTYNDYLMYYIRRVDINNYYLLDHRKDYWNITTAFYNKICAVFQIANQWNYNNSDSMSDYFDIGYFLDIDIKIPDDLTIRETMTDAERTAYDAEIKAEEEKRAAEIAKYEQERKDAEEAEKRRAEQEKKDRTEIDNNITVEDIDPIYISNLAGGIGKECSLEELSESIGSHHSDAVITRRVTFKDKSVFDIFGKMLLYDWDFCRGKGGTGSDDVRLESVKNLYSLNTDQRESVKFYMCDCIGVYVGDELQIVINPEGYNYPRYCYIPTKESRTTNAAQEAEKQRTESENLPPFYFPDPVEKQAKKLQEGQQITIYQCDGWNLVNVYGGFGTVLSVDPGTYAQYKGVYITLIRGGKAKKVFIRDGKKCLIYDGIKPLLPDTLTSQKIDDNMARIYNYDELFPRIIDYYAAMGEAPIIDTIQR